ncbi:MAG: hypothetical protein M0C28_37385 [Candidatus Moduliflexus flocculans]|nr:hypothetical protein [Candidatus Moduliflexus flocculans]
MEGLEAGTIGINDGVPVDQPVPVRRREAERLGTRARHRGPRRVPRDQARVARHARLARGTRPRIRHDGSSFTPRYASRWRCSLPRRWCGPYVTPAHPSICAGRSAVPHEPAARAAHGGSYFEQSAWWTKRAPVNRWGTVKAFAVEALCLHALRAFNRPLWWRSYPFHAGLYCGRHRGARARRRARHDHRAGSFRGCAGRPRPPVLSRHGAGGAVPGAARRSHLLHLQADRPRIRCCRFRL